MNIVPRRVAFIDVQNTETTAYKVLNFIVDWEKLYDYLVTRWNCEQVYFYPGIQHGDDVRGEEFNKLVAKGAIVRPKYYYVYKKPDKLRDITCPHCNKEFKDKLDMGFDWKCNCDVELTVDVLNHAAKGFELMLFTGDGDFEFLIKKVLEKEAEVAVISSAEMIKKGPKYSSSRLSTKLRNMTNETGSGVKFIEMKNIKFRISKD